MAGGAWVEDDELPPIVGVPDEPLVWVDLQPTRFGVWVTMQRTAGAATAYVWEVFHEV